MNATELQTRLKHFTYRIVVLCESLPPEKTSLIVKGALSHAVFSVATNDKATCKLQSGGSFKTKLITTFIETGETLFRLGSIVDLKLISPAQLSPILNEADELTRIFASSGITVEKSKHK
jgi:four helix bundle protein